MVGSAPWRGRPELPPPERGERGIPEACRRGFCRLLQHSGGQVGAPPGHRGIGVAESLKRRVRRVRRLSSWREKVRSGP